jgi:O-antigen ligase
MKPLIQYLKENRDTYLIALPLWILVGKLAYPGLILLIPVTFFYLSWKKKFDQVVILFAIMLIISDHPGLRLPGFMPMRTVGIVTMAILCLYQMRIGYYKISIVFLNLIPFLMVILLSVTLSPVKGTAMSKGMSFFLLYFIGFHFMAHMVKESGDKIIRAVVMNAILVLAIGLVLIVVNREMVYFGNVRFNGMFRNPNGLGVFTSMMLPFFYYYIRKYKPRRIFVITVVLMVIASLLLCSSRNALLTSSIFIIIAKGLEAKPYFRILIFGGLLPIVVLLISAISIEGLIKAAGLERYLRLQELDSGSGRTHAWAFAAVEIKKNPILGMGYGYEDYLFSCCMPYNLWRTGHQGGVHNSYLAILLNVGFIGLGLFLFFIFRIVMGIKDWKMLMPLLILYFATAVFESWMVASLNAFHIYFVILLSFLYYYPEYLANHSTENADEPAVSVH